MKTHYTNFFPLINILSEFENEKGNLSFSFVLNNATNFNKVLNSALEYSIPLKYVNTNSFTLTSQTTLKEILSLTNAKQTLRFGIDEKLKVYPLKKEGIEREIERLRKEFVLDQKDTLGQILGNENSDPGAMAYDAINKGLDLPLYFFANHFLKKDDGKIVYDLIDIAANLERIAEGVAAAYILPELEKELQELESEQPKETKQVESNGDMEIKRSHLIRSLQFIFDKIGADNYDKTEIAKLVFFLLNGKEANSRSEYQSLLNAISSNNKQPTNDTRKKNEEILLSFLNNLNIKM